jgi:hypothetical protein
MANVTAPFGLRPVRHRSGGPMTGAVVECYVSSAYATALYIGDPVLQSPTAGEKDPTRTRLTINTSTGLDGTIIHGVIVGFEPLANDLTKQYNPASTGRIAFVYMDDGNTIYEIRGNGGAAPTDVTIGQNAVMIAGTDSTITGLSGMMLDEGTTTAPSADQSNPLLIVGIKRTPDNEAGASAIYEVMLNTAENATGKVLGVRAA